jgi:hypothetical protein
MSEGLRLMNAMGRPFRLLLASVSADGGPPPPNKRGEELQAASIGRSINFVNCSKAAS